MSAQEAGVSPLGHEERTSVPTTLGDLGADELGWIDAHEHVIIDGGYTVLKEPSYRLDDVDRAAEELGRWKAAGGGLVVDAMPFGCGRNVDKLIAASRAAQVPIVVPTGFQRSTYYLPDHWQHRYPVEAIAELLVAECVEGVDRNNYDGPIVTRSPIRAGLLKVAGDYQSASATTRRLVTAAGIAHRATGVPILVHTEHGTAAALMLDLLADAGVDPSCVLLSHVDRNPDLAVHRALAVRGALLQYDTPGRIKYQPETVVLGLIRDLVEEGLGAHLSLGGDLARRSYLEAYGGGPGYAYLPTRFTERLREVIPEDAVQALWHDNPARWLTGARVAS